LFTDDIFVSMPPIPFEYQGRDVVVRLLASIFGSGLVMGRIMCRRADKE
jgi:RNA polymerase sigma-70 factor (ECF subfamily)